MLMSPAGRAATPPPLLCRHPAPFCGYKGQFRQYTGSAFLHTQAPGKLLHIIASLHTQARRMFLHVIANQCAHWCGNPFSCGSTNRKAAPVANPQLPAHSPRYHPLAPAHTCPPSACHCEPVRTLVWQSVLLRQHKTKSNTLGKYGKAANLPRESVVADADTPHVSACHCEPVRTLVWQSVLLRQHKPKSSACGESAAACALTPVPPSCTRAHLPTFCMSLRGAGQPPRDVAIRTPAAAQNEKQFFPANP